MTTNCVGFMTFMGHPLFVIKDGQTNKFGLAEFKVNHDNNRGVVLSTWNAVGDGFYSDREDRKIIVR